MSNCPTFPDHPTSLIDVLRGQARRYPERVAFSFLRDDTEHVDCLTYGDLDRGARAIAAELQQLDASGERILLLYPPGLAFVTAFFGCIYARAVAVPSRLPSPTKPIEQVQAIVADARPKLTLAETNFHADRDRWLAHAPYLRDIQWLTTDVLADGLAEQWRDPRADPEVLALLQYTSGSTAVPKGVMLTHGNLLFQSAAICQLAHLTADSRGVFWLPHYHDMGLIGGLLQTVYSGGTSTLMAPAAFLQRPIRWLRAISRSRATISCGPNFAYDLCVRKISPEERLGLDLSTWKIAFTGAEPIHVETLERFAEAFEPCGFRHEAFLPCYGLAEATLAVSCTRPAGLAVRAVASAALAHNTVSETVNEGEQTRRLVSCGRPLDNQRILIVDPDSLIPCPPDRVGEIWVAGPGVALGYWSRAEESETTFRARLAETGEGPFLRTGDLGFLKDGELVVTGRLKDLIIVHGANHYPHDLERTTERSHAGLQPGACAVVAFPAGMEEQVVVIAEVQRDRRHDNPGEIIDAVRQAIAVEHGLPVQAVVLVKPASIPRTSSGKVRRQSCRTAYEARTLDVIACWEADKQSGTGAPARGAKNGRPVLDPPNTTQSREAIQAWLLARIARQVGRQASDLDPRAPFAFYGLDSIAVVGIAEELERWLGRKVAATVAYDYPTIELLARYLAEGAPDSATAHPEGASAELRTDAIAVIGIGCRFPGSHGPREFWKLLCGGVDAIREVPPDRWRLEDMHDPNPTAAGKITSRWGGFLDQVDQFDPHFFGISAREATRIDPQQRLLLEVAWEALEDAGLIPDQLSGSRTGVFVGISTHDYAQIQLQNLKDLDAYWSPGNALSIAPNRISYLFDLRGPSLAVDTACSSSLMAVHLACQSLRSGESSVALAGGVNLLLHPAISISFARGNALASDGRCKAFDSSADGIVRGEGVGILVLKPLARAQADGDPIHAILRASAVNQDGRSNGLTAPNRQAQEALLTEAYQRAGISPEQVHYVETHGAGTALGDPIEALALANVLGRNRPSKQPLILGAVKTQLGHLEAAAGIAGLIKVVLALKHRTIPPNLHFAQPNPHIPFDRLPLCVPTTAQPWPMSQGPAVAGVSAFGFGGSNAHLVVQEAPARAATGLQDGAEPSRAYLVPISAKTPEALHALASGIRDWLQDPPTAANTSIADLGYTASLRRSHHEHRLALVAKSNEMLGHHLDLFLRGKIQGGQAARRSPRVAFVFCGQGGQWWGMGRELREQEPVFRAALEDCADCIHPYTGWSLLEEMAADEAHSRLGSEHVDVSQIAQFALQVALAALWKSWGIQPDAVVGHSMGEVAAAQVAGTLSLDDAARIICHRGRLMSWGLQNSAQRGAMALVRMTAAAAREALRPIEDRVSIAAHNSPGSIVLSGEATALEELLRSLHQRKVAGRLLRVPGAGHCPAVEPLRAELTRTLDDIQPRSASVPIYSTVVGRVVDGQELDADYWGRNLREPVLFKEAMDGLAAAGHDLFLEIGPQPLLGGSIGQCLTSCDRTGTVLSSLRQKEEERASLLGSLGAFYSRGSPVNWRALYGERGTHVSLPSYPWQRQRYWFETNANNRIPEPGVRTVQPGVNANATHPLLGSRIQAAPDPGVFLWQTELDTQTYPFLSDHLIQGSTLLPGTLYLEMAQAAARQVCNQTAICLTDVEFVHSLILAPNERRTVQLVLERQQSESMVFRIYSRLADVQNSHAAWQLHARGRIIEPATTHETTQLEIDAIRHRCPTEVLSADHYAAFAAQGVGYGPAFRGVERLWRGDWEALGRIQLPDAVADAAGAYQFHPGLLDACLQVLGAALPEEFLQRAERETYLPVGLEHGRFGVRPGTTVWSHARLRRDGVDNGSVTGDVVISDEDGTVLAEVAGFLVKPLGRHSLTADANLDSSLFRISWEPHLPPQAEVHASNGTARWWLVFADAAGVGKCCAAHLEAQGESCVLVYAGTDYCRSGPNEFRLPPGDRTSLRRLFSELEQLGPITWRGILHLWGLDAALTEDAADWKISQQLGMVSALGVVQEAAHWKQAAPPRLWLVTCGAHAVSASDTQLAVTQAPLWGFGRTLSQEMPGMWGGLVDLDPQESSADQALRLGQALRGFSAGAEVAVRAGEWFAPRLTPSPADETFQKPLRLRTNASYLITGGLGDLGLTVARWLVDQGARRVILLGRTPLPSRSDWTRTDPTSIAGQRIAAIRELEAAGAHVQVVCADIADQEQVAAFLTTFRQEGWPPILGVFHLAGTIHAGSMLDLDPEQLLADFASKAAGAWLLHSLLLDQPLDFFVLFSSGASLLGSPLLAGYASANAFLDSLACHRRLLGKPALSVNWGFWSESGLAVRHMQEHGRVGTPQGMKGITNAAGLEVLARLLRSEVPQTAVLPFDWASWERFHPVAARAPLLHHLMKRGAPGTAPPSSSPTPGRLRKELTGVSPDQRLSRVRSYLEERVAKALNISPEQVDMDRPPHLLGIDSLMAIEIKTWIETEGDVNLPIVRLLEGQSLNRLAETLADLIEASPPTVQGDMAAAAEVPPLSSNAEASKGVNGEDAAELLRRLNELSDDQVEALLNTMLVQEEKTR